MRMLHLIVLPTCLYVIVNEIVVIVNEIVVICPFYVSSLHALHILYLVPYKRMCILMMLSGNHIF